MPRSLRQVMTEKFGGESVNLSWCGCTFVGVVLFVTGKLDILWIIIQSGFVYINLRTRVFVCLIDFFSLYCDFVMIIRKRVSVRFKSLVRGNLLISSLVARRCWRPNRRKIWLHNLKNKRSGTRNWRKRTSGARRNETSFEFTSGISSRETFFFVRGCGV